MLDKLPSPEKSKVGWPWEYNVVVTRDGDTVNNDITKARDCRAISWPKITVIMPSYNQAGFIEESIRSVLLQDYPNLEFMVLDGGSSDGTVEIIKKYEPWIAYWESQSDRGQSHAINKGFLKSTGSYVAWLNSDDLYYPGALFAVGRAILENPEAGMIYGAGSKIDVESRVLSAIPYRPYNKKRLSTRFYILQQSSFVKRSALYEDRMVEEFLHFTMDWELSIRVSRLAEIKSIPDQIGMFRIHDECKTRTGEFVRKKEIAEVGRLCNGMTDRNYLIFRLFYPVFRYGLCNPDRIGGVSKYLCYYWRRAIALFVDPESHMMH